MLGALKKLKNLSAETYQNHPLYRALEAYTAELLELFETAELDENWPNEFDLEELERHLLDAVSQLGVVLELKIGQSRGEHVLELLGLSFNNFRIALNLLRNILLQGALQKDNLYLKKALYQFLRKGTKLERILWKTLNEVSSNIKP